MSKTLVINRLANGDVTIQVNSGTIRTIANPLNIIVKPLGNDLGCVCKTTDEGFRILIYLTDTVTINGTAAPTVLNDLIQVLSDGVFSGSQAYAAPAKFNQTITFAALPTGLAHTAPPFNAGATSSSGLACTYASSNGAVATVNATTGVITPVGAGTCNITASQAGNNFYNSATPVVRALTLT